MSGILFRLAAIMLLVPGSLMAAPLKIAAPDFEPFFNKKTGSGLFVELIRETFKAIPSQRERPIQLLFRNNIRHEQELAAGKVDAAANVFRLEGFKGHLSKPFFRYKDYAISIKKKAINLKTIEDLSRYSVGSYKGAKIFRGPRFKAAVENSKRFYKETPRAHMVANLVAFNRVDIGVGDIYIFLNTLRTLPGQHRPDNFDYHGIFEVKYSYMGFRDKKLRDEFNTAYESIKKSGRYEAIYESWLRELKAPVKVH